MTSSHRSLGFLALTALTAPGALLSQDAGTRDRSGFVSIFDGRTLDRWDGDPMFWRVENGMIVA